MNEIITEVRPECNVEISRLLAHPIERVYSMFSNADHLKNWWGPNGFRNTFHEFNMQPGGKWRYTMHGPEAGNYENEAEFLLVNPNKQLIWNHTTNPQFQLQFDFHSVGDKTNLVFKMIFDTPEECEKLRKYVVVKNEENLDRLESELSKAK